MSTVTVEKPWESLTGKRVLVMGLGHFGGGLGASKWLVSQGAQVTVTDAAAADKLTDPLAALAGLPITFKLGGHDPADLRQADFMVVNPAVDRTKSAFVQDAIRAGVPLTTEMNLFLERCAGITVGITGSVGKSTTTALIYAALKAGLGQTSDEPAQKTPRVFLGGNIGRSLLFDLPHIRPSDIVVLELSSFMLEETPAIGGGAGWSPHIAVVTNVFSNHLDRHVTMAGYTAAKQNILLFQKPADIAILNNDHELVARWAHLARGKVIKFTTRGPWAGRGQTHMHLAMPGAHNQSNAAAALAVLKALAGLPLDHAAARQAIEQFPGLAHRLQWVHTLQVPAADGRMRDIRFFNDSKATTPDASITAIDAFDPHTAIFIIGGYDKGLKPKDFAAFHQKLVERALAVIAIGQTGEMLLAQLQDHAARAGKKVPAAYAETLDKALPLAGQWAREMGAAAVVLSPASASWGQFANYEERGNRFAELSRHI